MIDCMRSIGIETFLEWDRIEISDRRQLVDFLSSLLEFEVRFVKVDPSTEGDVEGGWYVPSLIKSLG
jgi:hypothetical protein